MKKNFKQRFGGSQKRESLSEGGKKAVAKENGESKWVNKRE